MSDTLLASEPTLRLVAFLGVLVAMAAWKIAAPRRRLEIPGDLRLDRTLIQPGRGPASGHAPDARITTTEPAE